MKLFSFNSLYDWLLRQQYNGTIQPRTCPPFLTSDPNVLGSIRKSCCLQFKYILRRIDLNPVPTRSLQHHFRSISILTYNRGCGPGPIQVLHPCTFLDHFSKVSPQLDAYRGTTNLRPIIYCAKGKNRLWNPFLNVIFNRVWILDPLFN